MAFGVKELSTGGGRYFKADEHLDAVAILIEVKSLERQRPSAQYGPKDTIHADITIFDTAEALAAGEPSTVMKGGMIQGTLLVRDLEELVGEATIATVTKLPPRNGNRPAGAWVKPSADVINAVVKYGEAREAAKTDAIASAPDF